MQLIFASNNPNKVQEIRRILPPSIELVSLREAGIQADIPEPHNTLEDNAREKSSVIYSRTKQNCFSEDTGLEVTALEGAPGVRSARFAGDHASDEDNIRKLLDALHNKNDRRARFRTVISLILNGEEFQFEGICNGTISQRPLGSQGFGYDPVFIPEGETRSFGEMTQDEKKKFSHRSKATNQLISFLNRHIQSIPEQS